jgi:alpha-L-fucosidase
MRAGKVYLHLFDWPADGRIFLPASNPTIIRASFLVGGETLPVEHTEEASIIAGPASPPDPIDTVLVLETDAEGRQE